MEKYLVEKRPHPLIRNAEQWIFCFPRVHQPGRRGSVGLSVLIREKGPCEGAVMGGMSPDGHGGAITHDRRLLPGDTRHWAQPFKDKRAAKAWVRKAVRIFGDSDMRGGGRHGKGR